MQGKVFQRTFVAGFVPMNHVWSDKRDHLYGNCQIRAVFRRLEIERRERDSEPLTVRVASVSLETTRALGTMSR
jgi:hypothetical protein